MSEWLFSIKNQVKPNTYQKYESIVRNHISNEIGNLLVKLIKGNNISVFTDSLVKKKSSIKTINDILIILNLAFKYAEKEHEIVTPRIRYLKESKKEMRVLSVFEQQKLTNYLNSNMDIFKFGVCLLYIRVFALASFVHCNGKTLQINIL